MHARTYAHMHTCTHAHTHTRTHAHTHTRTHAHDRAETLEGRQEEAAAAFRSAFGRGEGLAAQLLFVTKLTGTTRPSHLRSERWPFTVPRRVAATQKENNNLKSSCRGIDAACPGWGGPPSRARRQAGPGGRPTPGRQHRFPYISFLDRYFIFALPRRQRTRAISQAKKKVPFFMEIHLPNPH